MNHAGNESYSVAEDGKIVWNHQSNAAGGNATHPPPVYLRRNLSDTLETRIYIEASCIKSRNRKVIGKGATNPDLEKQIKKTRELPQELQTLHLEYMQRHFFRRFGKRPGKRSLQTLQEAMENMYEADEFLNGKNRCSTSCRFISSPQTPSTDPRVVAQALAEAYL